MKYPQLVSMPSAVSDWLEEQLEARGIDSEVYTRYILSLLHAHTLDVIYPEEDLPFSQLKKDGGRGAAFHKRVRRAGAWWRHADADAEQIKRSAAVECLMSAAEQSCEIESLVDELCEKLKEVNSEAENSSNETNQDTNTNKGPPKQRKISPKELAEKYYAAFPPLNQKEENSYLSSNINLVACKWPSPEKSLNNIDLIAAKWTSTGSPKKTKRKPKRQPHDTMKSTSRTSHNRNRFGYKKAHCVRALTREMADNRANWEFVYNNNNNYKIEDQCLDFYVPNMAEELPDYFSMDDEEFAVQWRRDWMAEIARSSQNSVENNHQRSVATEPQFVPVYPSSIWSSEEKSKDWSKNEYSRRRPLDYFPGNERRDERCPSIEHESAIREEYQRCFRDEEECAIKMEYERPFVDDVRVHVGGQSLNMEERYIQIGGRWSTKMEHQSQLHGQDPVDFGLIISNDNDSHDDLLDSNLQNEANSLLESNDKEDFTPSVFRNLLESNQQNETNSLLESNDQRDFSPSLFRNLLDSDQENEANSLLENNNQEDFTPCVFRNFHSLPVDIWSRPAYVTTPLSENEFLFDEEEISFLKINHSKECSAFGEYVRPTSRKNEGLLRICGPYSRPFGPPIKGPAMPAKVVPIQVPKEGSCDPPLVKFTPIRTPPPERREEPRRYHDGATFAIRGSLDKIDFRRTNSGALYVETNLGETNKYREYEWQLPSDESLRLPRTRRKSGSEEFKLKFRVVQNDKFSVPQATQTEDEMDLLDLDKNFSEIRETADKFMESMDFAKETPEDEKSESAVEGLEKCDQCSGPKRENCEGFQRMVNQEDYLESENAIGLAMTVWKDVDENCKLCRGKHEWPNFMKKFDIKWEADTLKDIWEGTGMCRARPQLNKEPLKDAPVIRTDSRLREEVKEDAERLMSDLMNFQKSDDDSSRPTEVQVKAKKAPADRKRRHSYMDNDNEMWSFATRLQEDCLINLSTLPTRRSVTL